MRAPIALSLCLVGACTSTPPEVSLPQPSSADDLRAIEALNQHDIDAVLANDFDAIASQYAEDFTMIGRSIVRGREAAVARMEPLRETASLLEPLEYVIDWEEITVTGDYAFAWGTVARSSSRAIETGEVFSSGPRRILRIFQRQSDGAWKMYRVMSTPAEQTAPESDSH